MSERRLDCEHSVSYNPKNSLVISEQSENPRVHCTL
jgi:hypothetical protein